MAKQIIWAHPMNIEVSTAKEGWTLADGETVSDEGALILDIDGYSIVMESPADVLDILNEARNKLNQLILNQQPTQLKDSAVLDLDSLPIQAIIRDDWGDVYERNDDGLGGGR